MGLGKLGSDLHKGEPRPMRNLFRSIPVVCGAAALYLLTGFFYGQPTWTLDAMLGYFSLLLALAFMVSALLASSSVFQSERFLWRALRVLSIGALVLLPLTVAIPVWGIDISRRVIVFQIAAFLALLFVSMALRPRQIGAWSGYAILLLTMLLSPRSTATIDFDASTTYAVSSLGVGGL